MTRKILQSATLAVVSYSLLLQAAVADNVHLIQTTNFTALETTDYEPERGMSYTLGTNRVVGFFERKENRCALTLMLIEQTAPDGTSGMSATRVRVSIRPGDSAAIDSAEGKGVELSCNRDGKTVTGSRFNHIPASQ